MQQINLYQSELRTTQKMLSASKALGYMGFLLVILAFMSFAQWWQQSNQQQRLVKIKQTKQQILKQIEVVSSELAATSDDSEFKKILVTKEKELKNKKLVLTVLAGQKFGNTHGFAEQFTGLSRQHIEGLWLTYLDIHAGGLKLNLQGSTFVPESVPLYLQNLSNEPSFKGVEFKTFLMERNKGSTRVDFDIRSTQKETG
jgi:gamma-glutamylcysteine synthetase